MGKFQTPCILVVTDEPLIRHMVARLLASEGLWAVTAEHGEADFEGFARMPLALILVNSYLPRMTANEAVAHVGAAFPGVPILHLEEALSGSVEAMLDSVRALTHTERRRVTPSGRRESAAPAAPLVPDAPGATTPWINPSR
jgi:CheY-like chemotaxis protein